MVAQTQTTKIMLTHKRPRVSQATLVASYNWNVELKQFKRNLETVKDRIPEGIYNYLSTCERKEDIEEAIGINLGNKYIVELDWLYGTINVHTTVKEVRFGN
jgi:hypothetical protein